MSLVGGRGATNIPSVAYLEHEILQNHFKLFLVILLLIGSIIVETIV